MHLSGLLCSESDLEHAYVVEFGRDAEHSPKKKLMPSSRLLSDFTAGGVKGRPCPNCCIPMALANIKQSHSGFNPRNYECAKCPFAEDRLAHYVNALWKMSNHLRLFRQVRGALLHLIEINNAGDARCNLH